MSAILPAALTTGAGCTSTGDVLTTAAVDTTRAPQREPAPAVRAQPVVVPLDAQTTASPAAPDMNGVANAAVSAVVEPLQTNVEGWRLPWSAGETWYLTSGPHSGRRAALDFAPPNFDPKTNKPFPSSCSRQRSQQYWVRAVAPGRVSSVLRAGCPLVQIEHADGTATNYFHLDRKSVREIGLAVGDVVQSGQILGHPSCETGPRACGSTHASGVHVHFYRTVANSRKRLPADGMILSGWKVRAVGRIREGVLVKGTERRSTRGRAIGRACSPDVGLCSGQRNDLESDNVENRSETALSFAGDDSRRPAAKGPGGAASAATRSTSLRP